MSQREEKVCLTQAMAMADRDAGVLHLGEPLPTTLNQPNIDKLASSY